MKLLLIFIFISCSLTSKSIKKRMLETKIRSTLEAKRSEIRSCVDDRRDPSIIYMEVQFNKRGQVQRLLVNKGLGDRKLTDCLFKVMDLIYIKEVEAEINIKFNYKI